MLQNPIADENQTIHQFRGGLYRVLIAIKWGGRPTRLLPRPKMLLVPMKFFFLCWVHYDLESCTFSLSNCDFSCLFHTERSWHTYRFTVTVVFVSGLKGFPSNAGGPRAFSVTSVFEA